MRDRALTRPTPVRAAGAVTFAAVLLLTGCSTAGDEVAGAARPTSSASPTASASSSATPGAGPSSGPTASASPTPSADPSAPAGEIAASDPRNEEAQPAKDGKQTAVFARVAGEAKATCVAVGSRRDVRSGSIVGGPFDSAIAAWGRTAPEVPTHSVQLYWIPMNTAAMPGVTVTATNTTTKTTLTVSSDTVGDAEQWKYYSTQIVLRDAGTWRLQVSAGPDSGCFEMTVKP